MAKRRKTLGSPDSPCARELGGRIASMEKAAVCRWCLDYAENSLLALFERRIPGDPRVRATLEAARAYLAGSLPFREVKRMILQDCHGAARELERDPAAQAAARACAHAASTVHSQRHALGIYYYGAAALVYDRFGTEADKEQCETAAQTLCRELLASLSETAGSR